MSAGEFIPGSAPDRDCTDRALDRDWETSHSSK